LAAAVVSVLLLGLFLWWFGFSIIPTSIYVLLALIATLSVPIIYNALGFSTADEVEWLEEREAEEYTELIQRLELAGDELRKLKITEGVDQVAQLTDLIDDYHSVVETRFLGKKHMPLEYLSAARRVQKHAVQNLSDVVTIGYSMSTIESNNAGSQNQTAPGSDQHNARQARIEKNADLHSGQQKRMEELLNTNREMFDALTETAVEVANISSFSKYERIDTLVRLVSLAEIASHSGK